VPEPHVESEAVARFTVMGLPDEPLLDDENEVVYVPPAMHTVSPAARLDQEIEDSSLQALAQLVPLFEPFAPLLTNQVVAQVEVGISNNATNKDL
jgi:hypothetical protein